MVRWGGTTTGDLAELWRKIEEMRREEEK